MSPETRQELLTKVERRLEQRLLANISRWRKTEALEKLSALINERSQVRAYPNYTFETAQAELDKLQARVPELAQREAAALLVAVERFVTPEDARPIVATRLANTWAFGCDWGAAGAVEIGEGTWGVRCGGEYWGGAWTGPVGLFSVGLDREGYKWPEDVDSLEALTGGRPWVTSDGKEHPGWVNLNAGHLYSAWREVTSHLWAAQLTWKHLREVESGTWHAALLGEVATEAFKNDKPGEGAQDTLAGALRREVGKLLEIFGDQPTTDKEAEPLATKLDEIFAAQLEKLDEEGSAYAGIIRKRSAERKDKLAIEQWHLWRTRDGKVAPCITALARSLWIAVVKPEIERRASKPAGLVRALAVDRLLPTMTGQLEIPAVDDKQLRDLKGNVIGRVSLTTSEMLEAVRRGLDSFGSVPGHRLIRALVHRAHEAWENNEADPRKVVFVGGMQALHNALGLGPKYAEPLRDIAKAGQYIEWTTKHIQVGGLWTWSEKRGTRNGPGEFSFVLNDPLLPGYANALKIGGSRQLSAREARRLIPELRFEPPMGKLSPDQHGRVWTMHRLLLVAFVDGAVEFAQNGALTLMPSQRRNLAEQARLSLKKTDAVFSAWEEGDDGDKAPALIKKVGKDSWTLADAHTAERDFIAAGGLKRLNWKADHPKRKRRGKSG